MTNREKIDGNIAELNDDEFAWSLCRIHRCPSCPAKPLEKECHKRLVEWLKQEADND